MSNTSHSASTTSHTTDLSRRSFLGVGALVAAGAALGLTGCGGAGSQEAQKATYSADAGRVQAGSTEAIDWLGKAPEIKDSEIKETLETDVVIIGAGNAGMCAAAVACDEKLDFMLFEKFNDVQRSRHWFGALNTAYTKEAGITVDEGKFINEVARYASNKADQSVISVWAHESKEMAAWIDPILKAAGSTCSFDTNLSQDTGGTSYYIAPIEHYYGSKPERNQVFKEYIEKQGHQIKFKHELVKLIREDNAGKVTGAIFKTKDGYVRANARKAVMMCTGGYVNNPDMLRALNPVAVSCITLNYGAGTNMGDGIKAGMWIGAAKDAASAALIFDRGAVKPGVSAGYVEKDGKMVFPGEGMQTNLGSQPFLKVSRNGERIANESTPYDFMCYAASMHPGGVFCQIFDANMRQDVMRFNTMGCSRQTQQMLNNEKPIDEVYAELLNDGRLIKADTLEELAEKLGLPKESFLKTVERYNELYDAQEDKDFGKEAYRLSAIRQAPYYGIWYGGSILTTLDGMRINKDMQVLDVEGKVIEGLYASGDCSGSIFGNNYPEYVVGLAMGRSLTFSRHAIRHIAGKGGVA